MNGLHLKPKHEIQKAMHLAYAAFHCSSLRALAVSISDCVTKREPTEPEDIEGMSSIAGGVDGNCWSQCPESLRVDE